MTNNGSGNNPEINPDVIVGEHLDSETLFNVFSAMQGMQSYGGGIGAVSNPTKGINTGRDPSSYVEVNSFTYKLTHDDCVNLVCNSRIARNIVEVYPNEASNPVWNFQSNHVKFGADSKVIKDHFENGLKTGSADSHFRKASKLARLHGLSYILIGVNDNKDFSEEIDYQNIESLDWLQTRHHLQVKKKDNTDTYYVRLDNYGIDETTNLSSEESVILVHKSRLLKFVGEDSYKQKSDLTRSFADNLSVNDIFGGSSHHCQSFYQSSLQSAYDGFALFMQSILASSAMVVDYDIFKYGLDDLSVLVKQKKSAEIMQRFLTLQMSKSVNRGVAYDRKKEAIDYTSRNFSGLDKILKQLESFLVAETGMVRYKILGVSNDEGLGAEGRGLQERLQHAQNLSSWVNNHWKDSYLYLTRLYLLSKQGMTKGRVPKNYSITFPSALELTPQEQADLALKNIQIAEKMLALGIAHKHEIRNSLLNNNPDSVFSLEMDDRYSAFLENLLEDETDVESLPLPEGQDDLEEIDEDVESDEILDQIKKEFQDEDDLDSYNVLVTKNDALWAVRTKGRGTPIIVDATSRNEAIRKARKRRAAGSGDPIETVWQLTSEESKKARRGEWIRARYKGQTVNKASDLPSEQLPGKYRPQWKKSAIKKRFNSDDQDKQKFTRISSETENIVRQLTRIDENVINELISQITSGSETKPRQLKGILRAFLETTARKNNSSVNDLFEESIDLDKFIQQLAINLRNMHIFQAVIKNNGIYDFSPSQLSGLNQVISSELVEGKDPRSDKKFGVLYLAEDLTEETTEDNLKRRIELYEKSTQKSANRINFEQRKEEGGITESLRILGDSEHCPDCVEYAARGWVNLSDTILPKEQCQCGANCNCQIIYR